jgi:serine/threonine protein kinase
MTGSFDPPSNFNDYRLNAVLASGRMGNVYKAARRGIEGFERILCVKIIESALTDIDSFREAFVQEANRSVGISHANAADVLEADVDEETGLHFVASEYVNGYDLGRTMEIGQVSELALPIPLAVFIASEVAKALDYAHKRKGFADTSRGLLHRDVCPANILLRTDGQVKVTDFGIGRAMDMVPASMEPNRARRYRYAAPEHARGRSYSQQSDIFSLGLVLYEMIAGFHPYRAQGGDMRQMAAQADIPPLGRVVDIPRSLERVIDAMLVPDPAGRVGNAGTICEQLIGFLLDRDVQHASRALSLHLDSLRQYSRSPEATGDGGAAGLDEISQADVDDFFAKSASEAALGFESNDDAPALPGLMSSHYRAAQNGEGRVILLTGQFGDARNYLPDRVLTTCVRSDTCRGVGVQVASDDQHRPLGVVADLMFRIVRLLDEDSGGRPTTPARRGALDVLRSMDVDADVLDTVAGLWGLAPLPSLAHRRRRELLTSTLFRLLDELSFDRPVIVVIDRVERADPVSTGVLRDLVSEIPELPVLFVMSTSSGERVRQSFDAGRPEAMKAAHVQVSSSASMATPATLSAPARRASLVLALAERPMAGSDIRSATGLAEDDWSSTIDELGDAGLVREPSPRHYLIGVAEPSVWVDRHFDRRTIADAATRLVATLDVRPYEGSPDALAPMAVRLMALSGRARTMLRRADRYSDWLERHGWLDLALEFYSFCADHLSHRRIGSPQARIDYFLSRAELALELAQVDLARETLQPVTALTESARDGRGLARSQLLAGRMALQQDELREARLHLERAGTVAEGMADRLLLMRCQRARAAWWLRWGRGDRALQVAQSAENLAAHFGTEQLAPDEFAVLASRLSRTYLLRRMTRRAASLADELEILARRTGLARIDARHAIARADLAAAAGHHREALDWLDFAQSRCEHEAPSSLANETLLRRTEVAVEAEELDLAISLANQLRDTATRLNHLHTARRADELRALAVAKLGQDREAGIRRLRLYRQQANSRGVPREILETTTYLAQALEAVEPEESATLMAEARDMASALRLPLPS